MELETGLVITVIAMFFFYFRLAWLRGKKRRLARQEALAVKKAGKGAKAQDLGPNKPRYEIVSWWLIGLASVMMLVGLAARQSELFPQFIRDFYWIGTAGGALIFAFSFK